MRITHPVRTEAGTSSTPLFAAEANWRAKHNKYVSTYSLSDEAVQPLVFEVYGGYATKAHDFLRSLVTTIAAGDNKMMSRLWLDLRDRIAVALASGQAGVLSYFNFRNRINWREDDLSDTEGEQVPGRIGLPLSPGSTDS